MARYLQTSAHWPVMRILPEDLKIISFDNLSGMLKYVVRCAIWYHLYNLKNVKNTHGRVLEACNFTKINIPPWVFFTLFKLCKWYQIAQRITYVPF